MATTGAIATAVIATAGSTYSVASSNAARADAQAQAKKREDEQNALIAQAKKKEEEDQAKAEQAAERDQQRARQKSLAQAAQGRAGTILTSPLGVTSPAPAAGKTLLGT